MLGSAYIAGFKRALKEGADFIFEMDADHLHDYNDLPRFLKEMDWRLGSGSTPYREGSVSRGIERTVLRDLLKKNSYTVALLGLLVAVSYYNALFTPFMWDDKTLVVSNTGLKGGGTAFSRPSVPVSGAFGSTTRRSGLSTGRSIPSFR